MHRTAPFWLRLSLACLLLGGCASSDTADPAEAAPKQGKVQIKPDPVVAAEPIDEASSDTAGETIDETVLYAHTRSLIRSPDPANVEVVARIFADGRWERAVPQQGAVGTMRRGKLSRDVLGDVKAQLATPLAYEERRKRCRAMPMFQHELAVDGARLSWQMPCSQTPNKAVKAMMAEVEGKLTWTPPAVPTAPTVK